MTTQPASEEQTQEAAAPHLVVASFYRDEQTGATYVHRDLLEVRSAYEHENHVGPVQVEEHFGDVASWAEYVQRFGIDGAFATWNSRGLRAVLDYPDSRHWIATFPFDASPEWRAWTNLANGAAVPHAQAIEKLEELAESIVEPPQADLLNLLRNLRANVTAQAQTELRPDGTTAVTFQKDQAVRSGTASVELPSDFKIATPILKGDEQPWRITVRLRASVGTDAKLGLRFTLLNAERALEEVYAERVGKARELLGDSFSILRAAG